MPAFLGYIRKIKPTKLPDIHTGDNDNGEEEGKFKPEKN